MSIERRYEISILIGPCTQEQAEVATHAAHETVSALDDTGPGTSLNYWDEAANEPGLPVPNADVPDWSTE